MSIYKGIRDSILDGDAQETILLVKKALALKYPPEMILNEGLVNGINLVADKFKEEKVLIPEVLMSSRAVNAGIFILKPYLNKEKKKEKLKVVIGVVSGDLHDIGKNIVKTFLSTLPIEIIDLGIDVSIEQFISTVKDEKPDILMVSALLTTTMPEIKNVIDELVANDLRKNTIVFIGGAPITQKFKKDVGADYYIPEASQLRLFLKDNLNKLQKRNKE